MITTIANDPKHIHQARLSAVLPACAFIAFIPVVTLTRDVRLQFAALSIMLAANAIAAKLRGLGIVAQGALWVGALSCGVAVWCFGFYLRS
jgi:hypothetical protein